MKASTGAGLAVASGLVGVALGAIWARPEAQDAPSFKPGIILSQQAQVAARNPEGVKPRRVHPEAPAGRVRDQVIVKLERIPETWDVPMDLAVSIIDTPQGPRAVVEAEGAAVVQSIHLAGPREEARMARWSAGVMKDSQRGLVGTLGRSWGPVELRMDGYRGGAAIGFVFRW